MARPARRLLAPLAVLTLAAVVAAGCSAPPVSQATSGPAPTAAPPASAGPGESAAPTEPTESTGPTDAPPTSGPAGIPDKPADVTWERVDKERVGRGVWKVTHRITWTAPEGVATEFTVVAVKECLRYEARFDGKPCLVRGIRIPKDVQKVLKTVDGDRRSVDISWREGEVPVPPYASVLIRASNDSGDSIFTIVWSDTVCFGCVY